MSAGQHEQAEQERLLLQSSGTETASSAGASCTAEADDGHAHPLAGATVPLDVTVVLGLCSSVDSADGVLLSTLFRSLEMDLGLTPSELGMLSLFKSVSLAICLPLWGYASDIYAKDRLLTAAVLSWSVSSCVVGLALGFTTLALACALNAAVLGAIQVNPCPWPSWLKRSHRSNAVRCLGCYHWPPA
jgi:hypothetical protein